MINYGEVSPHAELLLTSAGPTTEAIQQRLLEMALAIKPASHLHDLRILRIADGWERFDSHDGVSLTGRTEARVESVTSRLWSNRYIGHVLGKATLTTTTLGRESNITAERLINQHDIMLVPGGNTWQTMKGLQPHAETIQRAVMLGTPYVGESAGSIVAGASNTSAKLPPADVEPRDTGEIADGLGLINFNIVVHAAGREDSFAIPGPLSKISSLVLKSYETPLDSIATFATDSPVRVETLNDAQALSASHGSVTRIG